MSRLSRRRFLRDSALLAAAASAPVKLFADEAAGKGAKAGANDKIRVAVIGLNGRGMNHVAAYSSMDDAVITALCDADTATFDKALNLIEGRDKPAPKTYQDIRRLLDDGQVDAVSIATPNHWHALAAIWAMQAGMDVYVEKPVSHNIFEGRKMVEAARRYGRICASGTQSRSNAGMRQAIEFLHSGKLGKITLARGFCYKPRNSIGLVSTPQSVPSTVDYDLWCGPAPKDPVMRSRFHYDWHWFWAYGDGDLGNQGAHEMDKARWGLNKDCLPNSVRTFGWRFGYRDNGETPNTVVSVFDYGDARLIFEVRGLPTEDYRGAKVGNIWEGTEGFMVSNSYSSAVAFDKSGNKIQEFGGGGDHFRNFMDAMRSRRHTDLNCDIADGHLSSALCHMGSTSFHLGRMKPLEELGKGETDPLAADAAERMLKHLRDNGVGVSRWSYEDGPVLAFDPATETFADQRAQAIARGRYREPFVVRERV